MDKRKCKKIEFSVSLMNLVLMYPDYEEQNWIMLRFAHLLGKQFKGEEKRVSQSLAVYLLELAKIQSNEEINSKPIDYPIDEMGLNDQQKNKIVKQLNLFEK